MPKRPELTVVQPPSWDALLRKRGKAPGKPIPDLANTLIILRNEPAFAVAFAFDEMQQQTIVRAKPPMVGGAHADGFPRFCTDEDVTRVQEWLQMIMPQLGREHVYNALEEFARSNPVHPLRSWLNSRELTVRQPVLENWLTCALGVANDAYHREVGRRFAIAMVARVMQPGCQADYMLVLEGPQGDLKSQFCRMLAGETYFSDHVPSLNSDQVRVSMHMRGKWLIEISELAAFNKVADVETLKAFITRREEIYTPKFGRKERREPRQCLFIGTTNVDEWNKDDSGARRFWPIKVVKIDLDWLIDYRDQLFAEAREAYEAGEPWWPTRDFERRVIVPQQQKRQAFDNWTDKVVDAASSLTNVTIAQIWVSLGNVNSGGDLSRLDMLASKRIATILRTAGYAKVVGGNGRVTWRKPE